MNELMAVFAGIGLAAACGFRVFVPLFIASLAANQGYDTIGGYNVAEVLQVTGFDWLGSTPVTIMLGIATALEIGAYYVPWIDNLLDSIASPAAVIAGTFITGAMLPDLFGDGSFKWVFSTIAGGGTAALVQGTSVVTRGASTATTGGVGNPVVSTAELGGAVVTAGFAILIPIIAGILVLCLIVYAVKRIFRYWRNRSARNRSNLS